jgi:hypothetical protein
MFKKASRKMKKLRLAIDGPSGSGKTWGALTVANALGKTAVLDTEHGSASLYSDKFEFDVMELTGDYSPERFIEAIRGAEAAGYDVLVMDSITPEWEGKNGCLDIQNKLGGRYQDWAKVTPRHDAFIQAILSAKIHIVATMRTKTEYVVEVNSKGKTEPRKVGTAPKQRDGLEYEFDAVFNLNQSHMASVSKDRTSLFDGKDFMLDGSVGASLLNWLENGEAPANQDQPDTAVMDYTAQIESASSLQELVAIWQMIPKPVQVKVAKVKDDMKKKLTQEVAA